MFQLIIYSRKHFFRLTLERLNKLIMKIAVWLCDLGYEIYWDDGNAQLKNYEQWNAGILRWEPGVIIFESTHNQELNLARDTFG